jgi:hypothetical protein
MREAFAPFGLKRHPTRQNGKASVIAFNAPLLDAKKNTPKGVFDLRSSA